MFKEIFTAIGVGRRVVSTIRDLKNDVQSVRTVQAQPTELTDLGGQMEALERRISNLEMIFQTQDGRLQQIEKGLSDAVRATEAVAQRASTIFWVSSVGCAMSIFAIAISITALALHR